MNTPFPQTEVNIEALENVKTRLFQLQESILFFLRSINPETTPGTVSWTELHSKFNVLIAKYLHLTNLVNDPHNTLLQSYTVFPNEAPATDQHVQNLSVLLRTKLLPELEQEAEDRIKEGTIPGLNSQGGGVAEDRKVLQALKLKVTMHDALCQAADEIFENQRDMINTRVRYESDDEGQGDINSKTTQRSGDKMKEPSSNSNTVPPVDDFAIGMVDNATSIRYMSEWGGTLHDVDGYTSDESADEAAITGIPKNGIDLDDSYFEARRQDFSSGDEESSQSDMESVQDDQGSEDIQEDEDKDEEEEEEEEEEEDDEDTFMEVRTGSQPIDVDSGPSSMQMAEDVFHEDAGNSGDEEEMEEVM